jgi:hypothetical protein
VVVTTSRFEIRNTAVFKTQSQKHAKLFFRYNRFPHFWGSRAKPYFVFSPCVDDEFVIDREHPFVGRYRYLITDAAPDSKWLAEQWDAW